MTANQALTAIASLKAHIEAAKRLAVAIEAGGHSCAEMADALASMNDAHNLASDAASDIRGAMEREAEAEEVGQERPYCAAIL